MLDRVVIAEAVNRRPHRQRARIAEQQRVAVGIGGGDRLGAECTAGAATVLYDDSLPQDRAEALRHQPRGEIDRSAGRIRHHHPDQPVGIALRGGAVSHAPGDTERGQREKNRTPNNHGRPPLLFCWGYLRRNPCVWLAGRALRGCYNCRQFWSNGETEVRGKIADG